LRENKDLLNKKIISAKVKQPPKLSLLGVLGFFFGELCLADFDSTERDPCELLGLP